MFWGSILLRWSLYYTNAYLNKQINKPALGEPKTNETGKMTVKKQ